MFTGREFDKETGLYYYRARYYNPQIGRFLQTDPIGYGDGMNWYGYCRQRPDWACRSQRAMYEFLNRDSRGQPGIRHRQRTTPTCLCGCGRIRTAP